MTVQELLYLRLQNQHLTTPDFKNPEDVVEHFGAVQAQEYFGAQWSIGQRMKSANESTIETAVNDGKIVRSWPMRGTLHFVKPENLRWMLKYFESRVKSKLLSYYKKQDLNDSVFLKVRKILEKELSGNKALTRNEIYKIFDKNKIATKSMRGLFIIGQSASDGIICIGPKVGKQHTFVLVDEWIKKTDDITKEEALKRIGELYFKSHSPATVYDLSWWAGITITDAKLAAELNKKDLEEIILNEKNFYAYKNNLKIKENHGAYLLPAYDEYTVSYKDRSELAPDGQHKSLFATDGFYSTMILNGKLVGMWRRTISKKNMNIQFAPIIKFGTTEKKLFQTAAEKYGKFFGKEIKILYKK